MKKWIALILLSFTFLIIGSMGSSANQYDALPKGKNYLSLSNTRPLWHTDYYSETIDPIMIKPNTIYTLVFDFDYLGQHTQDLSGVYVGIEEGDNYDYHNKILIEDRGSELAYVEFSTETEWIQIRYMPNGLQNAYNAMLYEGNYSDFSGFSPYVHPSETMNYRGLVPMDYDHPLTMNQIRSYITARNSIGQAIIYNVISDSYSGSSKLPGSYQMMFEVTHNFITKNYTLDLRIYDLKSPVISIPKLIEIPISERINVNQIKSMLVITDNVDIIPTSNLTILSDTYTTATTVGTYHVLFEASDFSGNKSTLEVPVTLVDKKGPVIQGPQLIYLYTTDPTISNSQILSNYKAIDDVDGTNVTLSISYNLYNQQVVPGSYQITLTSSDTQMNVTNRNIYIHVVDNKGPVFEINSKIIEKSIADNMSDAEIINWFKAQLQLSGISASDVKILLNEYDSNENEIGSYYVYLSYEINGIAETSRIRIDVIEGEKSYSYLLYISIASVLLLPSIGAIYFVKKKRK